MRRNSAKRQSSQAGISLIELTVVMVFLGIVLVAMMRMMTNSISTSVNVEFLRTAANLGNEKMEQIFADKRSQGYGYVDEDNYPDETSPNGMQGFSRSVAIETNTSNKRVTVTVRRQDMPDFVLTAWLTNY